MDPESMDTTNTEENGLETTRESVVEIVVPFIAVEDVKPTVQHPNNEINVVAKQSCMTKKGKVCFFGPLSGYLDVQRIKDQPPELKERCITGIGELKPILKRPTPALPTVSTFRLKAVTQDTPPQSEAPSSYVKEGGERRSFSSHPSCYEITHRANSSRKNVSLQSPATFNNNIRVAWVSTTPEDLTNVPSHSLLVRWKFSFTVPCYTIESVYTIMTRYGDITCLVHVSPNSALVVFKEVDAAKVVMSSAIVGFKQCPLLCSWFFNKMHKERFTPVTLKKSFYRPNAEEIFITHFRQQQKIITTCFRIHETNMFYDHKAYIP